MAERKAEFFKCDSCGYIKSMPERHVIKAAYTAFDGASLRSLQYYIYHAQLCDRCFDGKMEDRSHASGV